LNAQCAIAIFLSFFLDIFFALVCSALANFGVVNLALFDALLIFLPPARPALFIGRLPYADDCALAGLLGANFFQRTL